VFYTLGSGTPSGTLPRAAPGIAQLAGRQGGSKGRRWRGHHISAARAPILALAALRPTSLESGYPQQGTLPRRPKSGECHVIRLTRWLSHNPRHNGLPRRQFSGRCSHRGSQLLEGSVGAPAIRSWITWYSPRFPLCCPTAAMNQPRSTASGCSSA
jgi:hypothetical protein